MKIVRKPSLPAQDLNARRNQPWKILVVDDEPDVRRLTELNLRGFQFGGRSLNLLEADSAKAAQAILEEHRDIAMALIDVVMETDDAGLKLVEWIRNTLKNRMIRLIIRTGQPGMAPERYVIDHYDIDDYKDKTELTVQRLYTTVRSSIKSFRDLQTIEMNRLGLARILNITPELYNLHRERLEEYFRGVLTQIIGICNFEHSGMISTVDGLMATMEGETIQVRAGVGEFGDHSGGDIRRREIAELCSQAVLNQSAPHDLRDTAVIVPLEVKGEILGFVYLECHTDLSHDDRELVHIMANQCAAALDNFRLHHSLEESYDEAIDMLAQIAEFKDSATGKHIHRIQEYTRRLANGLGFPTEEADAIAKASRLHDVGKVGIPDHILRKPGKLTPEEYAVIQRHTRIAEAVLSRSHTLTLARTIAVSHHEHWDGNGYPHGLVGEQIPLPARIVAVVDVFDALLSNRPYKLPWARDEAALQIQAGIGSHFEPKIAETFLEMYRAGKLDDLMALSADSSAPEPPLLA